MRRDSNSGSTLVSDSSAFTKEWLLTKGTTVLGFVAVFLFFTFSTDTFFSVSNFLNIGRQIAYIGVLSVGMSFIIITGNIDLSAGSGVALFGVLLAGFMELNGIPLWMALPLVAMIAAAVYIGLGFMVAYQRIPAFIVTLAMFTAFRGLAFIYSNKPIYVSDQSLRIMGRDSVLGIPIAIFIMAAYFLIAWVLLHKSQFGAHVYAVGDNAEAARRFDIKTKKVILSAFAIQGVSVALCAALISGRLSSGSPNAGTSLEMDAIASVVLGGASLSGGRGSILGTLVGVLLLGSLNNGLNLLGVSSYNQMVVKGMIILFAVWLNYIRERSRNK
ncbi:MAG: ABC transporter permease [Kosmotogaceae bacterium]|nr:ABC transporter permease [Kosmotogaceae bacterium]